MNRNSLEIANLPHSVNGDPDVEPLPHVEGLPVDKFDFDLLPRSLQPWAKDMQYRLQCPGDFIGVGIMIGLATVVGNKVMIQPKEHDYKWKVVPNLWGLLVGSPSSMKSPALNEVMQFIYGIDNELREIRDRETNSYSRRLLVRDATIEALQWIQSENEDGILYVRDEISSLLRKLEKPENNDRQYFLEAFNGNTSFSADRLTAGIRHIPMNTLSLVGTIQPDVLQSILNPIRNTKDGFTQRLQLAVWPDPIEVDYVDGVPDRKSARIAWDIYLSLYTTNERVLRFCEDAQEIFVDWFKQSMTAVSSLSNDGQIDLANHISKYRKMVPALALLIELAEDPSAYIVSEESIVKAIRWANYLITHAKRIYNIQDKASLLAQAILNKKDRLEGDFSPSEVAQYCWSKLSTTADVKEGIDLLVEHHYLIKVVKPTGAKGGRPSERYRWNRNL